MSNISNPAAQAKRVILIILEFLKGNEFTTRELQQLILEKLEPVSLRTVQRDVNLVKECLPIVEVIYRNGQKIWRIPPKQNLFRNITYIQSCELLSFHILKAHLKTFTGTVIEDDIKRLKTKLEELAPGDVYSQDIIYWDQNNGQFDYTYYDYQLRRAINYITEKKWATVSYRNLRYNTQKTYDAFFHKIFAYGGYLYIATYIPKYDNNVALALHGIENIEECTKHYKLPEFNFKDYIKQRFGVYSGLPKDVVLKIHKDYKKYFVNRKWHPTQKESIDEQNNLILKMKVPIVPDFIAWILSWNGVIEIIEPVELIIRIKRKLEETLEKYETIKPMLDTEIVARKMVISPRVQYLAKAVEMDEKYYKQRKSIKKIEKFDDYEIQPFADEEDEFIIP